MWSDGPVVYEATFTTIQSARGKKGRAEVWSLPCSNHEAKNLGADQCVRAFHVTDSRLENWLSESATLLKPSEAGRQNRVLTTLLVRTRSASACARCATKGLSMRAIAAEIGCSVGAVYGYVAEQKAEQKTA
ncbi:hypothetical protein GCM10028828_20530 [Corynebacterium tapiri]